MKDSTPRFMTLAEYATRHGVNNNTVYAWKRAGLVVNGAHTNRIDVVASDDNLRDAGEIKMPAMTGKGSAAENFARDRAPPGLLPPTRGGEDQPPDDDPEEDDVDEDDEQLTDDEVEAAQDGFLDDLDDVDDFLQAATANDGKDGRKKLTDKEVYVKSRSANELIKATRERIKLQQLLDEVISRAEVNDAVFKMARRNRDGWLNWPKTIAVELAAELGVDDHRKVHDALLKLVRENLEHVAQIELNLESSN